MRVKQFAVIGMMLLGWGAWAGAQDLPRPEVPPPPAMPTPAAPAPQVAGAAWVLLDHVSGRVLAGHNERDPRDPASLTKIMTSYVVAAELAAGKIAESDEVFISENAWRQGGAGTDGSFSALAVNSKVRLDEVLKGLVVQSGNDAAIALAEHVAGSEAAFAELMNRYAAQLGMQEAHFVNAHGLTAEQHRMSARDVALLGRALIQQFPEHYALYSVKEYTYNGIRQYNRNGLLWKDGSVDGIKTGHTAAAGYCLAASAMRDGQRLISVVMGIEGSRKEGFRQREEGNQALLNWGFRTFETHTVYAADAVVSQPRVWKGDQDSVALGLAEPLRITIPRGRYADLKAQMMLPETLVAPIAQGAEVGRVKLSLDDEVVADLPLLARQAVADGGFLKRTSDGFWMWWESD